MQNRPQGTVYLPKVLAAVLQSNDVAKIGVNFSQDVQHLKTDFGVNVGGRIIELQDLARHVTAGLTGMWTGAQDVQGAMCVWSGGCAPVRLQISHPISQDPVFQRPPPIFACIPDFDFKGSWGLARMVDVFLHKTLDKKLGGGAYKIDWMKWPLESDALQYAVNDAAATFAMYTDLQDSCGL